MTAQRKLRRTKQKLYAVVFISIVGRLFEFILGMAAAVGGGFFVYWSIERFTQLPFDQTHGFIWLLLWGLLLLITSPLMAKEGFVELLTACRNLANYWVSMKKIKKGRR